VAIKVIVQLRAKPGGRDELRQVFEGMLAEHAASLRGYLGSTRYELLDDPDVLVEIADWESAAARDAHMQDAAARGVYAPLIELLAEPFQASVLSELS
jgi:quinol monooxygenase YgiN